MKNAGTVFGIVGGIVGSVVGACVALIGVLGWWSLVCVGKLSVCAFRGGRSVVRICREKRGMFTAWAGE